MISNPSHINFELILKKPEIPLVTGINYVCKIKEMSVKSDVGERKYLTLIMEVEND
jgi:hypothetical protein